MGIVEDALCLKETNRIAVAPVITARRELFEELARANESRLKRFDGFLLHPAVFDSGWVYLPSKPSLQEPVQVMKNLDDYEELSALGPVEYALKVHKERDFIQDLKDRLKSAPGVVANFVDETASWGVANYCGAMGITPIGFISYYRGFNDTMKDMARDQRAVLNAAMDLAVEYPKFLVEFAKSCKVPRVWVSFANATPAMVGDYYFERIVWPSAKTMIERIIKEGAMPIIQFDEEVKNLKFLAQLPPKAFAVHVSGDSDPIRDAQSLSGHAAVLGNFKVPADQPEQERIRAVKEKLSINKVKNLIVSTEGGSPFIMTEHNLEKVGVFEPFFSGAQ
ncbi:MAG: uroporphyrinogen decarboxylase family protein [Candidatus Verstraetearchaeota archaeon]|nr:uroporphyrinogen decarboxylase family protein [Candidatus Verstraetearchaeota archaeon]